MSKYTDWTSGEPIEKEWAMTGPTDPALRALRWESERQRSAFYHDDAHPERATIAHHHAVCEMLEALAAAEAAPLDVERLARTLENLWRAKWETEPGCGTVTLFGAYARDIAREYAALRSPDTETAGEAGDGL